MCGAIACIFNQTPVSFTQITTGSCLRNKMEPNILTEISFQGRSVQTPQKSERNNYVAGISIFSKLHFCNSPCACMHAWERCGILPMAHSSNEPTDGVSCNVSPICLQVWGASWPFLMDTDIMSQRCSIGQVSQVIVKAVLFCQLLHLPHETGRWCALGGKKA